MLLEIKRWKKAAAEAMIELFTDRKGQREEEKNFLIEELYREIGRLKVELNWLKKKAGFISEEEDYAHRTRK